MVLASPLVAKADPETQTLALDSLHGPVVPAAPTALCGWAFGYSGSMHGLVLGRDLG